MADSDRLPSRRRNEHGEVYITDDEPAVPLRPLDTGYSPDDSYEEPTVLSITREEIHGALRPDRESSSFGSDDMYAYRHSFTSLQGTPESQDIRPADGLSGASDQQSGSYFGREDGLTVHPGGASSYEGTLGSELGVDERRGSIIADRQRGSYYAGDEVVFASHSSFLSDGGAALRNSLIGQKVFAEDDDEAVEMSQLEVQEFERQVSFRLHQHGGDDGFSVTQSAPTEMLSNGGPQSSSSARIPSSALLNNGGLQSSSSIRMPSSALLATGRRSPLGLGNGGFQSSSSGTEALSQQGLGGLWMGQQSNENLAKRTPFERPQTRRGHVAFDLPRSHRISSDMAKMTARQIEGDSGEWEDVKDDIRSHSGNSTANFSDDSQCSSLRSKYDDDNNILLPPDYTRSAPSPGMTNGIPTEEYHRLRKLERLQEREKRLELLQRAENARRRKAGEPPLPLRHPFRSTPPKITAASSSSRAAGSYHRMPSISEDRRRYPPPHPDSMYHRGSYRDPSYSRVKRRLEPYHYLKTTVPGAPKRTHVPLNRSMVVRSSPTMVSLMSPAPRVEGLYDDSYMFSSPPPAPKKNMSKKLYTKKQMRELQTRVNQQKSPTLMPVIPILYSANFDESRNHKDGPECIKLSRYALVICAFTFVLLPFYGAGKLNFVVEKYTDGEVKRFSDDSRRLSWLVLVGEVVAIIVMTISIVVALAARSSS